jgi:hypothetical protein
MVHMNTEAMTQVPQEVINQQFANITAGIGDLAVENPMMDYVRAMQGIDMTSDSLMSDAAQAVGKANLAVSSWDDAYNTSANLAAFAAGEQSRIRAQYEDDDEESVNA